MSKTIDALKLALGALEESLGYVEEEAENAQRLYGQYPTRQARIKGLKDDARKHMEAITAIREALAEQPAQQQEHVSVMTVLHLKDRTEIGYGPASAGYDLPTGEYKLYTSPPASKPWVGLTDEEVDECYYWKGRQWTTDELVRHVEAKLREKNQ